MTDNTNALTLAFGGGFIGAFAYFIFVRKSLYLLTAPHHRPPPTTACAASKPFSVWKYFGPVPSVD